MMAIVTLLLMLLLCVQCIDGYVTRTVTVSLSSPSSMAIRASIIKKGSDDEYAIVKQAIQYFKKKGTSSTIPLNYQFPDNDDTIPLPIRGFKIGNAIRRIKYSGAFPNHRDELERLGVTTSSKDKLEVYMQALQAYKDLYGNVSVPRSFVITGDMKGFPEHSQGLKLGLKAATLRTMKHTLSDDTIKRLEALDFRWRPSADNYHQFLNALLIYKQVNGNLDIPRQYKVPKDDDTYPPELWGMKLGFKVANVRNRNDYSEYREELEALGLLSNRLVYDVRHWDAILSALKTFQEVHSNVNVPFDFTVPSREPWHPSTHGLKLGYRLHNIKYRGDFVSENTAYKQILQDLGFKFRFS
jgi:hypothetical protein